MIPFILLLLALAVDLLVYRYRIRPAGSRRLQRAFLALIGVNIALLLVTMGMMTLLPDNTTATMKVAMWIIFAALLIVACRWAYYLGLLFDRRRPWSRVGFGLAFGMAAALVWGATEGRQRIRVERIEIQSERLPAAFDGFRIAHFSDLHVGTLVNPGREIGRLIDTIAALQPDVILFSGDLVNVRHTELTPEILAQLKHLQAPYGVISTTGNHDRGLYIRDTVTLPREEDARRVVERQRSIGWQVLLDSTLYLRRGDDSISITGIAFDRELQEFRHAFHLPDLDLSAAYAGVPGESFNVTTSHLPQLWENITALGRGDLTLSGHVHSMQLKLHLFGHEFSPAAWLYDRWSGRYDDAEGHTLYINDGIGYVGYPVRLGANPEITLYTLTR